MYNVYNKNLEVTKLATTAHLHISLKLQDISE